MVKTRLLLMLVIVVLLPAAVFAQPRQAPAPAYDDGIHTELQVASWHGERQRVWQLLEAGAPVDEVDTENGATPLMFAAAGGHFEVMEMLLHHGANLSHTSIDEFTILDWASPDMFPHVLAIVLGEEDALGRLSESALDRVFHRSVALGLDIEILNILLDAGASPNAAARIPSSYRDALHHADRRDLIVLRNARGKRPIHLAFQQARWELVRELMERGCDVNIPDSHGMTALHWAAASEDISLLQHVLAETDQVDRLDRQGKSAAQHALQNIETLQPALLLLRECGADLSRPARRGLSIFASAAPHLSADAVRLLGESGLALGAGESEVDWLFRNVPPIGDLDLFGAVVDAMGDRVTGAELARVTIRYADKFEADVDTLRDFLQTRGVDASVIGRLDSTTPLQSTHTLASPKRVELALMLGLDAGAMGPSEFHRRRPIAIAARSSYADAVRLLLDAGQSPLRTDADWPMFAAMQSGCADTLELLLAAGADNELDQIRGGFLRDIRMHSAVLRVMVAFGYDIDTPAYNNRSLLLDTAREAESHRRTLERGKGTDRRFEYERERYREALLLMDLLVELGADPNHSDQNGTTILMHISDVEILRQLVELGASLEHRDQHGNTLLIRELFAYQRDQVTDKMRFLCEETDQINLAGAKGFTPLLTAARSNGVQTLKFLIEQGADLSALSDDGRSALELAMDSYTAHVGHSRIISEVPQSPHKEWIEMRLGVVKFLLDLDAPLGMPDDDGRTALHRPQEPNMLRALVNRGADVNARTVDEGDTPLIAAAKRRDAHAIKALLESGALPRIRNRAGQTAIDVMTPPASPEWRQRRQGLDRHQKMLYPEDTEFYRQIYEWLESMSSEGASHS